MGFFGSIGNIFKSVAKFALPAIGGILGGPLGGILGGLTGGLFGGGRESGGDGGIGAMQAKLQADTAKQKKEADLLKQTEEKRLSTLKARTKRGSRRSLLFTENDKGLSETLA